MDNSKLKKCSITYVALMHLVFSMLPFASQQISMTVFTNITIPLFVEHIFCLRYSDNVFSFLISIIFYLYTSFSLFMFSQILCILDCAIFFVYFLVHLNVDKVPCICFGKFCKSFIGIQLLKSSLYPFHFKKACFLL